MRLVILLSLIAAFTGCSNLEYRQIPVTSKEQASMVINNEITFLKDTFIQSREPYYGGLRWSPECLADNVIGNIIEDEKTIRVQSRLILNENGDPGFCTGEKNIMILLFCDGDKFVREYKVPVDSKKNKPGIISCD